MDVIRAISQNKVDLTHLQCVKSRILVRVLVSNGLI